MGVIRFLGQHKGAVALVVVLLALKAVCDLALPVFTSQIVDVGIAQSGVEDVGVLEGYRAAGVDLLPIQMAYLARTGLAMLAVAAAAMVLDVAVSFVASRTGAAIGRDLRSQLFGRIVAFSDAEINRFSAASLITRGTNDVVLIQNVCTMILRMVLYAPILAIGGVVMVMATNPQLGWIVVVAVAAVFAVIAVLFRLTLPRFKIMQKLIGPRPLRTRRRAPPRSQRLRMGMRPQRPRRPRAGSRPDATPPSPPQRRRPSRTPRRPQPR